MGSSYQADEIWTQSSTKLCSKFLQSTSPPRTSSQPAWFCGCVYHIVPSLWGRVTAGSFFFLLQCRAGLLSCEWSYPQPLPRSPGQHRQFVSVTGCSAQRRVGSCECSTFILCPKPGPESRQPAALTGCSAQRRVLWVQHLYPLPEAWARESAACCAHGMLSTKAGPVSAAPLSSARSLGQRVGSLLHSRDAQHKGGSGPVSAAPLSSARSLGQRVGSLLRSQDAQHKGGSCECSTFILCPKPGPESRPLAALTGCSAQRRVLWVQHLYPLPEAWARESAACCTHGMLSTKAGPVSAAPLSSARSLGQRVGRLLHSRDAQHKGGSCECSTFILCPKPGPESRQPAALTGCSAQRRVLWVQHLYPLPEAWARESAACCTHGMLSTKAGPVSAAPLSSARSLGQRVGRLLHSRDAQHKGGSCECSTFILCPKPGPESRPLAALTGCSAQRRVGSCECSTFILCPKPEPESQPLAALTGCSAQRRVLWVQHLYPLPEAWARESAACCTHGMFSTKAGPVSAAPLSSARSLGQRVGRLLHSRDVQHKGGSCECSTFILCPKPGPESRPLAALTGWSAQRRVLWVQHLYPLPEAWARESAACCTHGMVSTKAGPVSAAPLSSARSLGQRVGSLLRSQDVVAGKTHPHWFQHAQTPDLCLIAAASVADRCYGHLCFDEGHQWSDLRYETCLVICFLRRDFCTNVRWWKGQDTYCYHHPLPLPKESNSHSSSTY